jgi:hypothetical protein
MVIRCVMRRAWTHKFQSSGPAVYSLYCDIMCKSIRVAKRIFNSSNLRGRLGTAPSYVHFGVGVNMAVMNVVIHLHRYLE